MSACQGHVACQNLPLTGPHTEAPILPAQCLKTPGPLAWTLLSCSIILMSSSDMPYTSATVLNT